MGGVSVDGIGGRDSIDAGVVCGLRSSPKLKRRTDLYSSLDIFPFEKEIDMDPLSLRFEGKMWQDVIGDLLHRNSLVEVWIPISCEETFFSKDIPF